MIEPQFLIQGAISLLAVGGAWGGAKVALNGTRERVKEVQAHLQKHTEDDNIIQREMIDRAARIETKLDILMEKK